MPGNESPALAEQDIDTRSERVDRAPAGFLLTPVAALAAAPPATAVKPFVHPGMLPSREELDFVQQMVTAGKEPWKTAWEILRASKSASLDYKPRPRTEVVRGPHNNPNIGSSELSGGSGTAYTHALQWCLTGMALV